jgi:hypothetical protein
VRLRAANIQDAIDKAAFRDGADAPPVVTDIFWPREDLYREAPEEERNAQDGDQGEEDEGDEDE